MELSYFKLKQVAALKSHPGYILLVDSIKAQLDDATDQLRNAKQEDEQRLLAKWRVFTEVYYNLATKPEEFALEVVTFEQAPERQLEMPPRVPTINLELTEEAANRLKAAYEAKKNQVK